MILGFLAGFLASLLGWQLNLLALHRGLRCGRTAGFFVGMGAASADVIIILAAFSGAQPLLKHPHLLEPIKFIGIGIILMAAVQILFHRTAPYQDVEEKKRNPSKNFLMGFILVLGNPVVVFLWMAVVGFIVVHFPESHMLKYKLLFAPAFISGAALWFGFLVSYLLPKIRGSGEKSLHIISRILAVALLTAAVVLILEEFGFRILPLSLIPH